MLGTQALAAVSGMFPIVFFFIALVIGLGAGASVLIGQAWGAQETAMVKKITGATLTLGALVGLLAAVLGSVSRARRCRPWVRRSMCSTMRWATPR